MIVGNKFLDSPLQQSALNFAKEHHKGQYRKGSSRQYISHCMEVARILHKNGYSDEIIAAGLLHDTVEDTEVTLKDLERLFGEEVSNLVKNVSEDKSIGRPWLERKRMYVKSISNAPEGSVVISAADKLHNITETFQDWLKVGDAVFLKFNAGKNKQKWFYRSLSEIYTIRAFFFEDDSLLKMAQSIDNVLSKMEM